MFGIRTWWQNFRNAILPKLAFINDPAKREKAAKAVVTTINLVERASPFVKAIAALTPAGPVAVPLIDAAAKIGLKVEDVITEPDWHKKVGLVQDLGGEALKQEIAKLLPTFDHGLEIAGTVVTSAEQLDTLPTSAFHAPVVLAVNALRAAGEISSILHGAPAPTTTTAPLPPAG